MSTSGKVISFSCMHCSNEFQWNFQLQQHIKASHTHTDIFHIFDSSLQPEEHRCEQCRFTDYDKVKVHNHFKEVHTIRKRRRLKRYYKRNIRCKTYQSEHCDFTTYSCLVIIKHHLLMSKSSTGTRRRINCKVCKQFEVTFMLEQRFLSGEVWFKCSTCSYRSSIAPNLKRHIQSKHAYPERNVWFDCTECSYRSRLKSLLKKHMLWRHSNAEWLKCSECSFRTKLHVELAKHQHKLIVWFKCPECSYYCRDAVDALVKHVALMHQPVGSRWNCVKCSFESRDEVRLKQHMIDEHCQKSDTDWFACHQCSYSTAWGEQFVRHVQRHRPRPKPNQPRLEVKLGSPGEVSKRKKAQPDSPSGGFQISKSMLKQSGCSILQRLILNLGSKKD